MVHPQVQTTEIPGHGRALALCWIAPYGHHQQQNHQAGDSMPACDYATLYCGPSQRRISARQFRQIDEWMNK